MNKKRLILALGSAAAVAAPIAATISCTAWDQPITGGADLTGAGSSVWHGAFRNGGAHALPAVGNAYTVTAGGKKLSYTWTQADTDSKEGKAWLDGGTQSDIINYFARQFESANAGSSAETILNAFGISMHGVKFEAGGDAGGDSSTNFDLSIDGTKKTFAAFGHALIKEHSLAAGQIISIGDNKHTLSADEVAQFSSMTQGDQAKALELVGKLVGLDADRAKGFADTYNPILDASPHKGQVIDADAIAGDAPAAGGIDPAALDLIRPIPNANTGTTVSYTAYDAQDFSSGDQSKNPIERVAKSRVFYVGDLMSNKHAKTEADGWVIKGEGSMGYHSLFAFLKHAGSKSEVIEAGVKIVLTVGRFQYTRVLTADDIISYNKLVAEYSASMTGTNKGLEPGQKDTQVQAKAVRWLNSILGVDDIDRHKTELWLSAGHDEFGASEGVMRTAVRTYHVGDYADHKGVLEVGGGSSHGFHTMFTMFKHPFGDSEYDKANDIIPGDKVQYFFTSNGKKYQADITITADMVNDFRGIHKDYTSAFQAGKLAEYLINQISNVQEITVDVKSGPNDKQAIVQIAKPTPKGTATKITDVQKLDALKEVDGWLEVEGTEHTGGIGHRLTGEEKTFKVGVFADHHGAVEFGGGSSHGFHTLFSMYKHQEGDAKWDGNDALIVGDTIDFTYNAGADKALYVSKIVLTQAMLDEFDKVSIKPETAPGELVKLIVSHINDANTTKVATLGKDATTDQIDAIYKTAATTDTIDAAFKQAIIDQVNSWLLAEGTVHTGGIDTATPIPAKPTK